MPTSMMSDKECQIAYLKNDLELSLISRDIDTSFDALKALPFYEEDEDTDEKKEGILSKISDLIAAMLEKVKDMIYRFTHAISNIGKKEHINIDSYVQSETGNADWQKRTGEIMRQVDTVIASQRPIISAISDVTKMDPVLVGNLCDESNKLIVQLSEMPQMQYLGKMIVSDKATKIAANKYKNSIEKNSAVIAKANRELKNGKKQIKDREKKLRALSKVSKTHSNFASKILGWAK